MNAFAVWTGLALVVGACSSDAGPAGAAGSGASGAGSAGMSAAAGAGAGAAAGKPAAGSGVGDTGTGGAGASRAGTGSAGRGGSPAAAGSGSGGMAGVPGRAGSGATGGAAGGGGVTSTKFSFFVTSLSGMIELSKSDQGFGGDLKFGEATGLAGADKICTTLAEKSLPGSGAKGWHAFLSTAKGGASDGPIHAKDRIGRGPWYDRLGRLVANDVTALLNDRPMGADAVIRNDLPNERGEPNHTTTTQGMDDNHDTVTGSNVMGMYDSANGSTCNDWTSTASTGGSKGPIVGHSWPSDQSGTSWIRAHNAPGCAPSVALVQMGGGSGTGIGNAGGYGGFYCFALQP
jgi:hypothetical protein